MDQNGDPGDDTPYPDWFPSKEQILGMTNLQLIKETRKHFILLLTMLTELESRRMKVVSEDALDRRIIGKIAKHSAKGFVKLDDLEQALYPDPGDPALTFMDVDRRVQVAVNTVVQKCRL